MGLYCVCGHTERASTCAKGTTARCLRPMPRPSRAASRNGPHMWWGVLLLVIGVAAISAIVVTAGDGADDRSADHRDLHWGVLLALRLLTCRGLGHPWLVAGALEPVLEVSAARARASGRDRLSPATTEHRDRIVQKSAASGTRR